MFLLQQAQQAAADNGVSQLAVIIGVIIGICGLLSSVVTVVLAYAALKYEIKNLRDSTKLEFDSREKNFELYKTTLKEKLDREENERLKLENDLDVLKRDCEQWKRH